MVHNLVYNLCEPLVENIDGVAGVDKKTPPTPITYLTQWKIVGNSEVHTLPYPDGVVLPNGYKRCEYLEAHGTEYIELPIGFDNTDEIELTVSFTQINLSNKYAIAPKTWNDNNNRFGFGMHRTDEGDVFCAAYGTTGGMSFSNPNVAQDTNVHLFTYANYLFKLDNRSTKNVSSITFGSTTNNLKLFYGYSSPTKCRIYTYHQVKANNTEINLIPCLDDNDIPCLYDTVSGTSFYNDGTGTFGYELYPQPTEIWSCGEYNATDGKYHILVQPTGKQVVDIVLDEPLRKVNDVADTIEFPSGTEGKALVTRNIAIAWWKNMSIVYQLVNNQVVSNYERFLTTSLDGIIGNTTGVNISICLSANYEQHSTPIALTYIKDRCMCVYNKYVYIRDIDCHSKADFEAKNANNYFFYALATPTTELVDAPQIAEAESYTCVISQGGKAVEWTEFAANPT